MADPNQIQEAPGADDLEEVNQTPFIEYVRGPQFPSNPEAHQQELMPYGILHWSLGADGVWKPQQRAAGVGFRFFNTTDQRHHFWNGKEWQKMARKSEDPEVISDYWYQVLETKRLKEQVIGTLFVQIPWVPGEFMDVVRGPTLPTGHCYIGRVFYNTVEKKHYTFEGPMIGEKLPSWKTKSDFPEAMSPGRYDRIDDPKVPEALKIRVYCAIWMHALIQRENLREEIAVAAPFTAPPPKPVPRTTRQKQLDRERQEADEQAAYDADRAARAAAKAQEDVVMAVPPPAPEPSAGEEAFS